MKKIYEKPLLKNKKIAASEEQASLSNWLFGNNLEGAGITTYLINS